jgi:phage terminase small subunit
MNDLEQDPRLRVRAAVAAAQYVHVKLGDAGKKDDRQRAAEEAAKGKFAQSVGPRLVIDNKAKRKTG